MLDPTHLCDLAIQQRINGCMRLLRLYPTNPRLNSYFAMLVTEKGVRGGWR